MNVKKDDLVSLASMLTSLGFWNLTNGLTDIQRNYMVRKSQDNAHINVDGKFNSFLGQSPVLFSWSIYEPERIGEFWQRISLTAWVAIDKEENKIFLHLQS